MANQALPLSHVPDALRKGKPFQEIRRKKAQERKEQEDREEAILWDSAPCMPAEALSSGLEDYLSNLDEGFREMLLRKIDERQMTDAECYKRANIDRKLFNKIKNQKDYKPGTGDRPAPSHVRNPGDAGKSRLFPVSQQQSGSDRRILHRERELQYL